MWARSAPGAIVLYLFAFNLASCFNLEGESAGAKKGIKEWAENPRYLAWEGTDPVLLLGAGTDDNLFQQSDYAEELRQLQQAGGNFVRCKLHSRATTDRQPFATLPGEEKLDPARPDSAYWNKVGELLRTARSRNLVVQMESWRGEAYYRQVSDTARFAAAFREQLSDQTKNFANLLWAKAVEDSLTTTPNDGPMVTETSRRQYGVEGQAHWTLLRELREANEATPTPLTAAALTGHGANAAVIDGTAQVNRALLSGHAAVRHARAPIGSGFSDRALSNIRTIRTIEHSFRFWELTPAPEILLDAALGNAYPATDGRGNFLVYLDGPTRARINLPTKDQPRMRVSVVGYLGTQRSEVLEPPYGSVFEISTQDDRGAWLLMRRID